MDLRPVCDYGSCPPSLPPSLTHLTSPTLPFSFSLYPFYPSFYTVPHRNGADTVATRALEVVLTELGDVYPILHPEASSLSAAPATSTETQTKGGFSFFFACAERPRPPIKNGKQFHLPAQLWGNNTDMRVIIYRFPHKKKYDALWHKFSPWRAVKAWLRLTNYDLPETSNDKQACVWWAVGFRQKQL